MGVTPITSTSYKTTMLRCTRCNTVLPAKATFCGNCGERVVTAQKPAKGISTTATPDLLTRYRITSLVRRRPSVQLSFALDTVQQRPVVIRDIDISNLDEEKRTKALAFLQKEYDLLRRESIPDVMPLLASQSINEHLYSIAGWPLSTPSSEDEPTQKLRKPRLYILEDLLQSGIGLPDEQVVFNWLIRLSEATERLHQHEILLDDLDPSGIVVNAADYSGEPALLVSWLPPGLGDLLPGSLNTVNTSFCAPEVLQGEKGARSDVYSLGALLYLLLTGSAPTLQVQRKRQTIRPPHDLNPRVGPAVSAVVLRALATKSSERFASAGEFADALVGLDKKTSATRLPRISFPRPAPVTPLPSSIGEETLIASTQDNQETGKEKDAHSGTGSDDTVSVVPLQAQLARRYLSRMQTRRGSQELNGKPARKEVNPVVDTDAGEQVEAQPTQAFKSSERTSEQASPTSTGVVEEKEVAVLQPLEIKESEVSPASNGKHEQHSSHAEQSTLEETTTRERGLAQKGGEQDNSQKLPSESTLPPPQDRAHAIDEEQIEGSQGPEQLSTSTILADTAEDEHKKGIAQLPTTLLPKKEQREDSSQESVASVASVQSKIPQTPPVTSRSQKEQEKRKELAEDIQKSERSERTGRAEDKEERGLSNFKNIFSGKLPAISRRPPKDLVTRSTESATSADENKLPPLLQRVRRFIMGEQRHSTRAVALIETPMRVQPQQDYNIRIHIMGRNELKDSQQESGLSALVHGDIVHIEVRSALYQNYAYIVQQADVEVPAGGFAAEITIPMHSLTIHSNARRERLHIFFMDNDGDPLYEKPFVIELFISPLVHTGREGHSVLAIPL